MSRKWLERTEKLFGEQTIDDLSQKTVAVLGLGGVGGAAAEAVCRMGVGKLVLIDNDTVDITNLNRQLLQPLIWSVRANVLLLKKDCCPSILISISSATNGFSCRKTPIFFLTKSRI